MFSAVKRTALALCFPALTLSGCYVIPISSEGPYAVHPATTVNSSAIVEPLPAVLSVRLYPVNEAANRVGMVTGMVTNMMTGKGRFQLTYQGELLTGEATRVQGDDRRGIANAYGSSGTSMNCQYQLTSPYRGTGDCTLSDGARYQVHIGS